MSPDVFQKGQTWIWSGGRLSRYLHVLHEDLSSHAHLQHSVEDQFAVGREHVSAHVKVLQPLRFRAFAAWGIQVETERDVKNQREKRTKQRGEKRLRFIGDNGFSRWKSKITEGWGYGCDTMWLQSFTGLIKQARRWARVNGIFSQKEIVLILWFNSGPLPSQWSLIQRLIENTVYITKSLPDQSNKAIAFITCSKTNNPISDVVEGSLRSPTRTCIDFSGQAHIWIQYISEGLSCSNKLLYL